MNRYIAILIAIVLVLVIISQPKKIRFQSSRIATIRAQKDHAEGLVAILKSQGASFEGRVIYLNAMVENNRLITAMIVALGESRTDARDKVLNDLYEKARGKYLEFHGWYNSQSSPQGDFGSGADAAIVALVEVIKLENSSAQEQRAAIRAALKDCTWRAWDDI